MTTEEEKRKNKERKAKERARKEQEKEARGPGKSKPSRGSRSRCELALGAGEGSFAPRERPPPALKQACPGHPTMGAPRAPGQLGRAAAAGRRGSSDSAAAEARLSQGCPAPAARRPSRSFKPLALRRWQARQRQARAGRGRASPRRGEREEGRAGRGERLASRSKPCWSRGLLSHAGSSSGRRSASRRSRPTPSWLPGGSQGGRAGATRAGQVVAWRQGAT